MKYRRNSRPTPRTIVVKYAGKCVCCGGEIKAGETATYYPPGTAGVHGAIGHTGGLEGTSARCTAEIRKVQFPEYAAEIERRAVDDYAGRGLDERYEDDCARRCGLL